MDNLNNSKTIILYDIAGAVLRNVSQIEAGRLLRADAAELLLVYPPAIKIKSEEEYQKVKKARGKKQFSPRYLHARRSILYGNYQIQHPNGELMFKCSNQKALWYINRQLVDIVSQNPPVLRLRFNPAGNGHVGDQFYLGHKFNKCVVCGCEKGLNRHHVVPILYRRSFPSQIKNHNYHDIVLLCLDCHEKYEKEAEQLKHKIGEEYGFPLGAFRDDQGNLFGTDPVQREAITAASALLHYSDTIPEERKNVLRDRIKSWTGEPVTEETIKKMADGALWKISLMRRRKEGFHSHGEYVGKKLDTDEKLRTFIVRWRNHFLQTMNPQHLPAGWDAEKPIFRGDVAPAAEGSV